MEMFGSGVRIYALKTEQIFLRFLAGELRSLAIVVFSEVVPGPIAPTGAHCAPRAIRTGQLIGDLCSELGWCLSGGMGVSEESGDKYRK
jgi:hypothetical protein